MTKDEYEKKYRAIATSSAHPSIKEEALDKLNKQYRNVIEKAMVLIEESAPDDINEID